jgi:hypothetical protein
MDMNEKKNFLIVMCVMCVLITSISFYNFLKNEQGMKSIKPTDLIKSQINDDDINYLYYKEE